jgi:hypothetical protein
MQQNFLAIDKKKKQNKNSKIMLMKKFQKTSQRVLEFKKMQRKRQKKA